MSSTSLSGRGQPATPLQASDTPDAMRAAMRGMEMGMSVPTPPPSQASSASQPRSQPPTPGAVDVSTSSIRPRPQSAPQSRQPLERSASHGQVQGVRSGMGGSSSGVNLREIHYEAMRRAAAVRDRQREERENEVDRHLDASRPRRPASAPSSRRSSNANTPTRLEETQQRPQPQSQPASPATGYQEPSHKMMGDFQSFVQSGQWPGASRPTCGGYPRPRKPFTSIPGYGGYVPRKIPDSIMGCTFSRGNILARNSVLQGPLPAR